MKKLLLFAIVPLCGLLISCSKESGVGLELKYLIKSSYKKPTKGCRELAAVSGFSLVKAGFTQSYESSMAKIRKETHAQGGNFIYIKRAATDGSQVEGVAYSCSKEKEK